MNHRQNVNAKGRTYQPLQTGVERVVAYLGDQPASRMDALVDKLDQKRLRTVMTQTAGLIAGHEKVTERWVAGFCLGSSAMMGAVFMQEFTPSEARGAKITRLIRVPHELPEMSAQRRLPFVIALCAEGTTFHDEETDPLFETLAAEWGGAYTGGITIGIGYAAQRFDVAWKARQQEKFAAQAAAQIGPTMRAIDAYRASS